MGFISRKSVSPTFWDILQGGLGHPAFWHYLGELYLYSALGFWLPLLGFLLALLSSLIPSPPQ